MKICIAVQALCCWFLISSNVGASTCGYEACPTTKPDMLNVHIICHTHDDVGWLHTVDTYYDMWVKDIISSVVSNLVQDENRKFSYVEMAFFSKWWNQQTDLVKEYVTRLVNDGRLEFVGGGWSMNDEATTHYLGIIDQMTIGLRWLNETFGKCAVPKVGWQIDTFGHSREQASLFAQMGFDGEFIGRIHYQDKFWRQATKNMEVLWQTSESLGEKSYIFAGVLPNVYWPPRGFCFDVFCGDEELTEDNINMKGHKFIALAEEQAKQYASNHIAITMGMDFHFRDAAKWYRNLDFLIQHVNSLQAIGIKVNMFYSSPTCYLNSLNKANVTWKTMTNDFFPYASKQHEYWTGYFTSRPAFKYYCRYSSSFLQACKQLVALSDLENADIMTLHKALGVVQHHDGITGTEKQHVVIDYIRQLSTGVGLCQGAIIRALLKLMTVSEISYYNQPRLHFCGFLNMSQCQFTEMENEFSVIVYNPLSHYRRTYIRLPVLGEGYNVTDVFRERSVAAQIIPIPLYVINLSERLSLASNELIFPVTLPPLGVSVYDIRMFQDFEPVMDIESARLSATVQDAVIGNEYYEVKIDGHTGLMKEIAILPIGIKVPVRQSFYYYEGMPGYRIERASGAYAFNPQYDLAFALGENVTYRIFKGNLVEEVHQYFTPWISQVIRVYRGQQYVEFDWVVGPIPVHDHIGREIISRFDTTLNTNSTFYTDSNGRETIKRVRNRQENWPWNVTEHIAGNYYPVTTFIYVKDVARNLQLSVLTDRAQGGSSVNDGSIELMVHRRLLFDDGYGVNEALNEPGFDGRGLVVRGTHYLTLGAIREMTQVNKHLAKSIFHDPIITFMKQNATTSSNFLKRFRGLTQQLPPNIHILTLEKLPDKRILLRLEHFMEKTDDPDAINPVTVSLSSLFTGMRIVYFQETTLAANQYLYEVEKLRWPIAGHEDQQNNDELYYPLSNDVENFTNVSDTVLSDRFFDDEEEDMVLLRPMEIRTFILKVEYDSSNNSN